MDVHSNAIAHHTTAIAFCLTRDYPLSKHPRTSRLLSRATIDCATCNCAANQSAKNVDAQQNVWWNCC